MKCKTKSKKKIRSSSICTRTSNYTKNFRRKTWTWTFIKRKKRHSLKSRLSAKRLYIWRRGLKNRGNFRISRTKVWSFSSNSWLHLKKKRNRRPSWITAQTSKDSQLLYSNRTKNYNNFSSLLKTVEKVYKNQVKSRLIYWDQNYGKPKRWLRIWKSNLAGNKNKLPWWISDSRLWKKETHK